MKFKFPIKLALASLALFLISATANSAFAAPNNHHRSAQTKHVKSKKSVHKANHRKAKRHAKQHRKQKHQKRCAHAHASRPKSEPVLVKRTVRVPGQRPTVTYTRSRR